MDKFVDLYSVVEYFDGGEINGTVYDDKEQAEEHIANFMDFDRKTALDVCGLDRIKLHLDEKNVDKNGEITYKITVDRVLHGIGADE